jgi:hypothetical protein
MPSDAEIQQSILYGMKKKKDDGEKREVLGSTISLKDCRV